MEELNDFIDAITNEEFVLGHEVLEEKWKEYKVADKKQSYILKGLINGSTSLALYKMGRTDGAKRVWQTFLKYENLIDTLPSQHTTLYKKARDILYKKHNTIRAKV